MKSLAEIKEAVDRGENVYWSNSNYKVIKDSIDQYYIWSQSNDSYIGLTYTDGETLNGDLEEFYIKEDNNLIKKSISLCDSVLEWWEEHRHDATGDYGEYNVYDEEPEFVTKAKNQKKELSEINTINS